MITKQQQAVADLVEAGPPEGFADRVDEHVRKLVAARDVQGLSEFSAALVLFSQVLRGAVGQGS